MVNPALSLSLGVSPFPLKKLVSAAL
uniref:Uncharacterized protein n=1 Tax=Anguilla anguilla TaxID=7936 RepID=A0A0E9XBT7_ANGAN